MAGQIETNVQRGNCLLPLRGLPGELLVFFLLVQLIYHCILTSPLGTASFVF